MVLCIAVRIFLGWKLGSLGWKLPPPPPPPPLDRTLGRCGCVWMDGVGVHMWKGSVGVYGWECADGCVWMGSVGGGWVHGYV